MVKRIVISGQSSGIGKTSFVKDIIKNLSGNITSVKCTITENIEKPTINYEVDKNINLNKDTGRFLKAGAFQAAYIKADLDKLKRSIE